MLVDPANPDQTDTTIRNIKEECSFLGSLKHTNVVQYLGVARDREMRSPVLLMELLPDGESLTEMLKWFREKHNELHPYFIELNICYDIASAVKYLHSIGVILRNLSSNNVMVIAKTRAKVADFGMCRLNDSINTASSGTASMYVPPEAYEQKPKHSPKFDCFSQGVIMIQVCTRELPDPGARMKTIETKTGPMEALIPEYERRILHISQIQDRDELLDIAKDCLKDKAKDRPESAEICERLATLKTSQKYRNSLESDYEKLWKDTTIHQTRILIDSEKKMKEYTEERNEIKSEGNTGDETNLSIHGQEQFEQMLKKANRICILVVGTSGDGVSTLFEKMKPHGIPDLIIYSQKMGESIDVVSQTKHKSVIARLTARLANPDESTANVDIWKRCMFVLTYANEYEISQSEQRDKVKIFNRRWEDWKKIFKEALRDSKVNLRKSEYNVYIAGFRATKLHKSNHWLSDIWLAAFLTLPKNSQLALLRINAFRFVTVALPSEDIHPAEQLIAGIGAAGTASAVTGAAIGGTIGAVAIGIVSFGVAAGAGLALGVAIGGSVGLGVSGGVAAAVKRYKENKNFTKLPALDIAPDN